MKALLTLSLTVLIPVNVCAQIDDKLLETVLTSQKNYWAAISTIEYDYVLTHTKHLNPQMNEYTPFVEEGHLVFDGMKYKASNKYYRHDKPLENDEVSYDGTKYYAAEHEIKSLGIGTEWKLPGDPISTVNPLTLIFNIAVNGDDERSFRALKSPRYWSVGRVNCLKISSISGTSGLEVEAWFMLTNSTGGGAIQKVIFKKSLGYYPIKIETYVDPNDRWKAIQSVSDPNWPGRLSAVTVLEDYITTESKGNTIVIPTRIVSRALDDQQNEIKHLASGVVSNENLKLNASISPNTFVLQLKPGWRLVDTDTNKTLTTGSELTAWKEAVYKASPKVFLTKTGMVTVLISVILASSLYVYFRRRDPR